MKLSQFLNIDYKRKHSVPKSLDEEGDTVSSYFRTCEGNVGNYTPFVSYKMTTFWLALPS